MSLKSYCKYRYVTKEVGNHYLVEYNGIREEGPEAYIYHLTDNDKYDIRLRNLAKNPMDDEIINLYEYLNNEGVLDAFKNPIGRTKNIIKYLDKVNEMELSLKEEKTK